MGKRLVVGIHSDAEILKFKGCPPIFNEQERYEMVRAIKWVDEVIEDVPYVTDLAVMDKYNCQYCAHGDDPTVDLDGNDSYAEVKNAGRMKIFKRTQGVSSTNLVQRMLMKADLRDQPKSSLSDQEEKLQDTFAKDPNKHSPWTGVSRFLATSQKIAQFMAGSKEATSNDTVVYVAGAFDMFHNGHLEFLKAASKLGTYLVVGLHTDEEVARYRGHPIMNLDERTLSCLACRYVNEVVIGAPYKVDNEIINHFNVKFVCHGKETPAALCADGSDAYEIPKNSGIYYEVDSQSKTTADYICDRILANKAKYELRNKRKEEKEMKLHEKMQANLKISASKNL